MEIPETFNNSLEPEGLINMGQVGGRPGLTQSLLVFGDLILTAEGRNEGK